jgi:hypothetical protein
MFVLLSAQASLYGAPQIQQVFENENLETKLEKNNSSSFVLKRLQILQMPSPLKNFRFNQFKSNWITSEKDWIKFWNTNARTIDVAPKVPVDWKTEAVLAIFWESKDDIIRIPTFMGIEEFEENERKDMRITFALNSPCAGIITDASPAQFLIINHELGNIDSISIRTEKTKSVDCF